jgi:hypothetical protein
VRNQLTEEVKLMSESDDRELRFVMEALCRALSWDIETDNDGNYVIYPGIRDPYYSRGKEDSNA